ncbi:DUF4406 domain-containing protein [Candidatus Woesearchaeota archaeon]|nr:DUF4406 domain-containing protein [Candidatus Woesearchaeota archaeon]
MTDITNLVETEGRILAELQGSLSAYASMVGWSANCDYASTPITTGKRLYDSMRDAGVRTIAEFKQLHPGPVKEIMRLNIEDGEKFAIHLRETEERTLVISPATFFMKGWTQDHYMSFWERVIEQFATRVRLNKEWHYSNGCAEECRMAFATGKQVFEGACIITPNEAVAKLKDTIREISTITSDITSLYNTYRRLELLAFTRQKESDQKRIML